VNGLDLFSGIGGVSLALEPWAQTVAYCERDRYAQGVLLSRMQEGRLHRAPIWDDITTLTGDMLPEIDIVFGGFPCQDISVAGAGRGMGGERSGLYSHLERIVGETKPAFVFLENVPAIRTRGLGRVVWGLASLGYDLRWTVISAASLGAPHKRDRWFLLATDANRFGLRDEPGRVGRSKGKSPARSINDGAEKPLADSASPGSGKRTCQGGGPREPNDFMRNGWWTAEPDVGRVANGISNRVDQVRCLGNSVVPIQARKAFMRLAGIE